MNARWPVFMLAALPVIAAAQQTMPPDIDPVTLSRLPPVRTVLESLDGPPLAHTAPLVPWKV